MMRIERILSPTNNARARASSVYGRRVLAIGGVSVLVFLAFVWWCALPRPLFDEPLSTVAYARDGALLGAQIAVDGQWRFPAGRVPLKFAQALIAFEDKRFYDHHGVDPLALGRALYVDVRARRIVSGGSTISMQTIRVARGRGEFKTWDKLAELALAFRLEASYSKEQILSLYAAHAPFGGNVIGLEAAAWRYFGRSAQDLSWAEACTLAVLPNSPSLVHLGRQRAVLEAKRNRLLHRLHERNVLDATALELALTEPLIDEPKPLPQLAPHLLSTLQKRSPAQAKFVTTLDANLQAKLNDDVARYALELRKQDIRNIAVVVIDNRSFATLAYIGNSDWSVANDFGYAVDIAQRPRSTGSILKPFLYASMLQAGDLAPRMLLADIPTQYGGYTPENYDRTYRGAVPADAALAQSLNVPAVRMLRDFGVGRFYDVLKQLGLSTLMRTPDDYGLALILGGAEGTLWDITQSYANLVAIARDSLPNKPVVYHRAQILAATQFDRRNESDIGPAAAWLTLRALTEVARPGEESHWKNFSSSRSIAWKTGTSFGFRDAWSVGSTSQYTVGIWVGNASGEGRPGLVGGVVAAPLMFTVFQHLQSSTGIAPPRWAMKQIDVCRNDGFLANGECETEREWIPRESYFDRVSPHNVRIHLDMSSNYRIDGSCASVADMRHSDWFVLPPAQEYYYRRAHSEYRALPAVREGCESAGSNSGPIEFLYPGAGTRVYIPLDFGAQKGRVIFEAVHRDRDAILYWHIDDRYLGATTLYHQQAVELEPGQHSLTVVDQSGQRKTRRFEVLGTEQ